MACPVEAGARTARLTGMKHLAPVSSALFAAALAVAGGPAASCACCPDPGYRETTTVAVDDWQLAELLRLRLGGEAEMYVSPCGLDCVTGVTDPRERYTVALLKDGRSWTMTLAHDGAAAGTLAFALPERMESFRSDPEPEGGGRTPVLYAEARLAVRATGTGDFGTVGEGIAGTLILLGRQNSLCGDIDAFTHWMFDFDDPRTDFRLYGRLAPALPP